MNESVADSLVGQVVAGKFKIIELIHKGGSSTIYKADHTVMDKTIAIKMMAPHLMADVVCVRRFQQGGAATARLSHPSIIKIYDFGISGTQPFMVMECHQGSNMMSIVERDGPLSVSRFRKLFFALSDAMSHSHEQGFVHRDLKPSHFLVSNYNPDKYDPLPMLKPGDEFPVVIDFNLSVQVKKAPDDLGEIIGTPLYMSPEQSMGKAADARSDIYSMGCSMYFALTGEPPFQGTSILDTMQMHMGSKPNADRLPEEVRDIVLKATEKNPDDRFQSMRELADMLKR